MMERKLNEKKPIYNADNRLLLRFNMSSQVSIEDFLGKVVIEKTSEGETFKFQPQLFTVAFSTGCWLLLDELNLAQDVVLQCIETALETKVSDFSGSSELIFSACPYEMLAQQVSLFTNFRCIPISASLQPKIRIRECLKENGRSSLLRSCQGLGQFFSKNSQVLNFCKQRVY